MLFVSITSGFKTAVEKELLKRLIAQLWVPANLWRKETHMNIIVNIIHTANENAGTGKNPIKTIQEVVRALEEEEEATTMVGVK